METELEEIAAESMGIAGIKFQIGGAMFRFPVAAKYGIQKETTFRPDFKLISVSSPGGNVDAKIDGRTVFLEVHGGWYFNKRFVEKLSAFMKSEHHETAYLALAVDNQTDGKIEYVLERNGLKNEDIADRFWRLNVWQDMHTLLSREQRVSEHVKHLEEFKREFDGMKVARLARS